MRHTRLSQWKHRSSILVLYIIFFFCFVLQVTGRDGKPLPPWIVYDATSRTVRGQPGSSDAGDWAVRVDGPARDIFTIRVRRQAEDDGDTTDGSGDYDSLDYSENDDAEGNGEEISPNHPVTVSPTTPAYDVLLVNSLVCASPTLIESFVFY